MTADAQPTLDGFPFRARDKLRYADTDRQGHVNNSIFNQFLETGRVEVLYDPKRPLAGEGCGFVLARLVLDFRSELRWPGEVEVGTRVARIGRSSITLEEGVFQSGRCVATAQTVVVHMDEQTRRSTPLRERAREHLSSMDSKEA